MSQPEKKPRIVKKKAPNWSQKETSILLDLCQQYPYLDDKYDNNVTRIKKTEAWKSISESVTKVDFVPRSPDACKRRHQNVRSRTSKKVRTWINDTKKTGKAT